jgi:sugar phosphate isomerase/epimerase
MPWTPVNDLLTAHALIKNAGTPSNARILADTIHVERSRTTLKDWAELPASLIDYVQFCDAPAGVPDNLEEILRQARYERLLPGEGGIDLLGFLRHLPVGRPIAVECWHHLRTPAMGFDAWARQALQATQNTVQALSH